MTFKQAIISNVPFRRPGTDPEIAYLMLEDGRINVLGPDDVVPISHVFNIHDIEATDWEYDWKWYEKL